MQEKLSLRARFNGSPFRVFEEFLVYQGAINDHTNIKSAYYRNTSIHTSTQVPVYSTISSCLISAEYNTTYHVWKVEDGGDHPKVEGDPLIPEMSGSS